MKHPNKKQPTNSKIDPCQHAVVQLLQSTQVKTLWLTDENFAAPESISPTIKKQLTAVTNRFDVQQKLLEQDIECLFNDFDFTNLQDQKFDQIIYRLSKEKAVIHHILNNVHPLLAEQGKLILIGQKNDGIKRFSNNAQLYFSDCSTEKNGISYSSTLSKPITTEHRLDDDTYETIRPIATITAEPLIPDSPAKEITLHSKPGTFGWEKIDAGSQFLIEQLPGIIEAFYNAHNRHPKQLLDLGCGYGYLTLMTAALDLEQRTATDNNAAALLAMQYNAKKNHLDVDIIPANCAEGVNCRVDLLLCNPPFHQGFQTDESLTEQFLQQSKKHLSEQGIAVFVVNAFIPLENKARRYFRNIKEIANNKKFKVHILSNTGIN